MLIAITGDTHGRIDGIRHHLQRLKPDYLIHTGDYYTDGKSLARGLGIGFTGVRGNCDTGRKGKLIEVLELPGLLAARYSTIQLPAGTMMKTIPGLS
jgi:predicted phosphodiesterase